MLEDDELAHGHFAAGGAVIVFKHIENGLPEHLEVFFGEAGHAAGEVGGNEALCAVKAVGHDVFAAHFGGFVLGVGFGGDGSAGNGDLLRHDGVNGASKAELHRAAYLTAV